MYVKKARIQRPISKNLIINIHKIFPKIPKIRTPTKTTLTPRLRLQEKNRKSQSKKALFLLFCRSHNDHIHSFSNFTLTIALIMCFSRLSSSKDLHLFEAEK